MQKLYKIEIFDNTFNLVGHSAIIEPDLAYDYISMSTTSIACLDEMPNIRQYQLAHITDNDGKMAFQGVEYGFTQEKNALMRVILKPLLGFSDNRVYDGLQHGGGVDRAFLKNDVSGER